MSKLSEYLHLIPKGLPNSISIIQGVINNVQLKYGSLPEEEKDEIIRRRLICTMCPFNYHNAKTSEEYFELTKTHYRTKREDAHCAMCSCPIDIKTASLYANCGMETWNDDNPLNEQELKWKAIK